MYCSAKSCHMAWQYRQTRCIAIHQQYTGVLTLFLHITGVGHAPSWMKILGNLGSILDGCTHRQDAYTCEAIHQQYKDDLEILAPHWMDAHMYRDGMTVLAVQMWGYTSAVHMCAYTTFAYHWSWPRPFLNEDISDGMTVLADMMHTNVRLYISSTQVCLHCLCVSLVFFATPLPIWQSWLHIGWMYTCSEMSWLYWQTRCIQMWGYTSAVHRCAYTISAYHCCWPRPFLDEDIWQSWLHIGWMHTCSEMAWLYCRPANCAMIACLRLSLGMRLGNLGREHQWW